MEYKPHTNDVAAWKLKLISGDPNLIPSGMIEFDDGFYTRDSTELKIAVWGLISE